MNPLPGDLFARRLRQERKQQGVSQVELARRIAAILGTNLDQAAIVRIEQQVRAVRLDEAVAAARALGVPLSVLIDENSVAESEAQLQHYFAELALAQEKWEQSRVEIVRLTRAIHTIADEIGIPYPLEARTTGEDREDGREGGTGTQSDA
ncbi:helix-turn-helix domain-containing protein [Streptomyces sp. NRRL F-5053]|uniref:helix-turn-helix domain-containing protein n=1 Tax=Streptomyces sp. NRRL F-5053 TaxID=1463854 RepID=UPI00099D3C53|nr:helix-turn-helix transcriptional regulator [Streptomyces sp. NRRL F-5053]